ncbi:MAG: VWA domain-containing protein [Armatimonadetes bacterium]|nr:VWA domain-containing protein [Armatimonadota bacterium]
MPITFQHWPWLLLLPPLAAWLVLVHRRSLSDLAPWRRRTALALRLVIALLLVGALAGATIVKWSDSLAVWFLVDASDSVAPEQRQRALNTIAAAQRAMRRDDLAGIILFGADALIEAPLSDRLPGGKPASTPITSYTDVARALRLALAAAPSDNIYGNNISYFHKILSSGGHARRVVLLSDGNENLGSAVEEAALAVSEGVPVDVVPLEQAKAQDALLERMALPNEVKIGEPFELRLVAASDVAQEAVLRLYKNNAYTGEQKVTLAPGKNVFVFSQTLDKAGFTQYEARLEPAVDGVPENNRALGFSLARGRPRVLYVEGDPGQSKYLAEALRRQKIDADVVSPTGIPRNLAEFQNYDSILLSNVSALYLSAQQMELIQSNVRDLGQGFGMIGGDESFGVGGYYRTPVEETLPVDMDVTKQKEWATTAVVCVIDKSGSMSMGGIGYSKVDLAKEAAVAVVEVLGERDEFGVVCFDGAAKEVVPLQFVKDRGAIQERIATIVAGGGTNLYPGMMMAYEWLKQSDAKVKHCILLTDGNSAPADFNHALRSLNGVRATVSAVAIGTDSDRKLLEDLAVRGGGRFYYTEDPQALPRIFTKEAMLVAKSLIVEEPFVPKVDASAETLRGLDWSSPPPLLGYVATTAKSLADVPMRTKRNDPLFAHWRYGLGRAIAFTSDCKARWGAHWLQWPGYQKFWGQAIRWTLRRGGRANFQTVVDLERGRGHVTVDAIDEKGEFVNFLRVRANVVRPDMTATALPLRQTGPGRYEGEFEATAIGAYMVNVSRGADDGRRETEDGGPATGDGRRKTGGRPGIRAPSPVPGLRSPAAGPPSPVASQTAGVAISYPPEYRDLKTNTFVLHRLAERTGGRVLKDPSEVFGEERRPARVPRPIWEALLLAALLLFPMDVALRRLMIEPAEAWAWLMSRARALRLRRAKRAPARDATLGRLLQRKSGAPGRGTGPMGPDRTDTDKKEAPATPQPPTAPEGQPRVVWGPGAGPGRPPAPPPEPPAPAAAPEPTPEAPSDALSPTERLLRARRRARGDE